MSALGASSVVIVPSTADSSNLTLSPSKNLVWFAYMKDTWVLVTLSAAIAMAPLFLPTILSPITISPVVPVEPFIEVRTAVGQDGSVVSNVS